MESTTFGPVVRIVDNPSMLIIIQVILYDVDLTVGEKERGGGGGGGGKKKIGEGKKKGIALSRRRQRVAGFNHVDLNYLKCFARRKKRGKKKKEKKREGEREKKRTE